MFTRLTYFAGWLKKKLGPLGWGAVVVFAITRLWDIANVVCRLYLGKVLPQVEYGAIDPVLSLTAIVSLPLAIPFMVAVKSISRLRSMGRESDAGILIADLMKKSTIASILSVVVILLLQEYILERLHLAGSVYVLIVVVLFILAWWTPVAMAVLQGTLDYRLNIISALSTSVILLLLTITLVGGLGLGLRGALVARVVAHLISVIVVLSIAWMRLSRAANDLTEERSVMRKMYLPMAAYLVSIYLLLHFDKLLVRNFLLSDSGGYGAVVMFGAIVANVMGPLVFVVFPLASAEHSTGRDIRLFYKQAVLMAAVIMALLVGIFALLAESFMSMWNIGFAPYAKYVWIYVLAMGLNGIIQIVASVEMARHQYSFLWSLAIPSIAMCCVLYSLAAQSRLTVSNVVMVLLLTHIVILVGIGIQACVAGGKKRYA